MGLYITDLCISHAYKATDFLFLFFNENFYMIDYIVRMICNDIYGLFHKSTFV